MVFAMIVVIIIAVLICIHYSNLATDAIIEKRKLQREVNSLKAKLAELSKNNIERGDIESSTISKPVEIANETVSNSVKKTQIIEEKEVSTTAKKETTSIPKQEAISTKVEEKHFEKKIESKVEKRKSVLNEEERKNTSIMATGAVLVVLAAIVFLSSTWSLLSNLAKTVGLLAFLVVFAEASKISKEKYHLEKASKTFFYLTMAYIPICFISISVFGLLGEFLSIYGEGIYIYFFVSSCITALVYYYFYYTKSDLVLFYGSILAQAASMVLFVLIFSNDVRLIMAVLLAYNLVLSILCSPKTFKLLENISVIVSYIAFALSFLVAINISWVNALIFALLALNFLMLYIKVDNDPIYAFVINIALCAAGGYWIFAVYPDISSYTKVLIAIIYSIAISIINILVTYNRPKYSDLQVSSIIVNLVATVGLYIFAKVHYDSTIMLLLIEEAFLFFALLVNSNKDSLIFVNYAIPIGILLLLCDPWLLTSVISFSWVVLIICIIGELFRNTRLNGLTKGFMVVGGIAWGINYLQLIEYGTFTNKIILLGIAVYYLFRTKKSFYKYLSYLAVALLMLKDIEMDLIVNWKYVVPALSTLIIAMLEIAKPNLKDNYSDGFIAVGAIISYLCLTITKSDVGIVIAFPFSAALYFYYVVSCNDKRLRLIPLIGLIAAIRIASPNLTMLELWEIIYVVILMLITVTTGNISYEAICSGIMLFVFLGQDLEEKIISSLLFVLWSVLNLITATENEKIRDVFTGFTIASATYFYYVLIDTLGITDEFKFPVLIGVAVATFVFMEKIVKKYTAEDSYQLLEYIVYGLICFSSLFKYNSVIDGMFFVLFWIVFAAMSYKGTKNGRFVVSILAILVNAFLLTRNFWFSLPWWIYLLFAGMGMIGFAVKNEFNSNSGVNNNLDSKNIYTEQKNSIEDKK